VEAAHGDGTNLDLEEAKSSGLHAYEFHCNPQRRGKKQANLLFCFIMSVLFHFTNFDIVPACRVDY